MAGKALKCTYYLHELSSLRGGRSLIEQVYLVISGTYTIPLIFFYVINTLFKYDLDDVHGASKMSLREVSGMEII